MAKIRLGSPPKSFPRTIQFDLVDGGRGEIEVQFRYRTREEYARFMDSIYPTLYAPADGETQGPATMERFASEGVRRDADHVLGALVSWDLEDELNRENVILLANTFPAAILAITEDYRLAVTEGRAKN